MIESTRRGVEYWLEQARKIKRLLKEDAPNKIGFSTWSSSRRRNTVLHANKKKRRDNEIFDAEDDDTEF